MAKKVVGVIKLQVPAGKANPAPPVGPALGQHGVNIRQFCDKFNADTKEQEGMMIPVVISVYGDRSFTFITKTPPVADLVRRELGIDKGSGVPNRQKVGVLTREQAYKVARMKMPDLNCYDEDAAFKTVVGTCHSMGVDVEEGV